MKYPRIAVGFFLVAISIYSSFVYQLDPKHCDGNFIQPSYQTTAFLSQNAILNKRYTLVRHIEAGLNKRGIPVLFLAGNAGTFKQVRSLGAVWYRTWKWEFPKQIPLELYTIDTREELTAFSTTTLKDQAFFANEVVSWLLDSYPENSRPRSVYIIGHSMAGVIARYMPTLDNYRPSSVENLFTLATPHREAPVPISRDITVFYANLNDFWSTNHKNGGLKDIALVSIAGGTRDTTLDSSLTSLNGISDPKKTVRVFSSGVNGIWTSADHEGAVWCDQILQILSKSIYSLNSLVNQSIGNRIGVLRAIIEQEPNPQVTPVQEFIPSTEILVSISENHIAIPKLQNSKDRTNFKLWWPPLGIRNLYRFRLITNLSENELEMYSCDGQNHSLNYTCININQHIKFIPSPNDNFEIVFRSSQSPPSENRKRWMTVDMDFPVALVDHQFLVLKTNPGVNGFLFSDVTKPSENIILSKSPFVRIFGIKTVYAPNSILTIARFAQITDGLVKYRLYVNSVGALRPAFPIRILQKVGEESKWINGDGSLISIYPTVTDSHNNGLIFYIWADNYVENLEISLVPDLFGTLGFLTGSYKFFFISIFYTSILFGFSNSGMISGGNLFLRQYTAKVVIVLVSGLLIFYASSLLYPKSEFGIGSVQFLTLPIFGGLVYTGLFFAEGLYEAMYLLLRLISKIIGNTINFMHNRRLRIGFFGLMLISSFILPLPILHILLILWAIFLCASGISKSVKKDFNHHQIFSLLILMFGTLFKLPHLLQWYQYYIHSIPDPLPNDYISYVIHLSFSATMNTPLKRNFDMIAIVGAVVVLTFGWKNLWTIDVFNLLLMSGLTASRIFHSQANEFAANNIHSAQSNTFKRD